MGYTLDGEETFILIEKPVCRGQEGLWQYDDNYQKTGKLHFTCPYCAGIQTISKKYIMEEDGDSTLLCPDGELYESIWCRNPSCKRHLWIRLGGFKRKGPS
jgi:hypothetical protein